MLTEALQHLLRGIVANPESVRVKEFNGRRGHSLEVKVAPGDMGKVIGRQGRTAQALRTVISALSGGESIRIDFQDATARPQRRGPQRGGSRGGRPQRGGYRGRS
ncbi:MAG: RNA-binding protein [Propionibacteriaceae bacterium]|jgi:predicted RNA-binding protein YlqC (UPF0109 family)|nr:RNA-binding protein [Propionibacteriaceae bacterium]